MLFLFQSIAGSEDSSLEGVCRPLFTLSIEREPLLHFVLPALRSLLLSCCCCAFMSAWRPRGSRFQRPRRLARCTVSGSHCGLVGAAGWPHTAATAFIGVGGPSPLALMARRIAGMLSGWGGRAHRFLFSSCRQGLTDVEVCLCISRT